MTGDYDYLRGAASINHQVIRVLVAVTNDILKPESSKCIIDLPRVERREPES
jgi:hypothetical protein